MKTSEATHMQNIKVFYRVFPQKELQWEYVKILDDLKTVYVRYRQDLAMRRRCNPRYWTFTTDGIFYNNTQQEIYDGVLSDRLVERYAQ